MPVVGYSGKTLADKLGIRSGATVLTINAPDHYRRLMDPLPAGVAITQQAECPAIVHAFVANCAELAAIANVLPMLPKEGGTLWVSWPKKSSKRFIDLSEDGVREALLPTGWVDVKVCAIDEDWSGLKFLRRRTSG